MLFDDAGVPKTGQTGITFASYTDNLGNPVSAPAISEIAGGAYGFTPNLPSDPNRSLIYIVNTNGANPRYVYRSVRPEDYAADSIPSILSIVTLVRKVLTNRWKVWTTTTDQNKLVHYDDDGATVLFKLALTDSTGAPTTSAPFERTPTA